MTRNAFNPADHLRLYAVVQPTLLSIAVVHPVVRAFSGGTYPVWQETKKARVLRAFLVRVAEGLRTPDPQSHNVFSPPGKTRENTVKHRAKHTFRSSLETSQNTPKSRSAVVRTTTYCVNTGSGNSTAIVKKASRSPWRASRWAISCGFDSSGRCIQPVQQANGRRSPRESAQAGPRLLACSPAGAAAQRSFGCTAATPWTEPRPAAPGAEPIRPRSQTTAWMPIPGPSCPQGGVRWWLA